MELDAIPVATSAEKAAWFDLLGRWRAKAAEFERAQTTLAAQAEFMSRQPPAVRAEYQAMTARAAALRARIMDVSNALRAVESWLKGAFTVLIEPWQKAGVKVREWLGLGAAPAALIPIAVVTAALAAVSYFLVDFARYMLKVSELRRLQATGLTPDQAAAALERLEGPGLLGGMQGIIMAGALLALAIFVLPRLVGK